MRYTAHKCGKQNRWYVWDSLGGDMATLKRGDRQRRYFNRWQATVLALLCNSLEEKR